MKLSFSLYFPAPLWLTSDVWQTLSGGRLPSKTLPSFWGYALWSRECVARVSVSLKCQPVKMWECWRGRGTEEVIMCCCDCAALSLQASTSTAGCILDGVAQVITLTSRGHSDRVASMPLEIKTIGQHFHSQLFMLI